MANSTNTSLIHPDTITTIKSGILLSGVFENGTIFNGPDLLKFECEYSRDVRLERLWQTVTLAVVCYLFVTLLAYSFGRTDGQNAAAEKIAKCKNEKERIECVNLLRRRDKKPFKKWPGEQEAEAEKQVADKIV